MKQSINLPLSAEQRAAYGGWDGLAGSLAELGLDGVEGIWVGEDIPADFPPSLLVGYHLTFFPDWLDFYRDDQARLAHKFGSAAEAYRFYGGRGAERLLSLYRADLARAAALSAAYVVFHVSDTSNEESYTYRWLHTNREVLDASLEIINELLPANAPYQFRFLMENQWWPGFTFTEPRETAYLLERVNYPKTGIMLDTGHLLNTNIDLKTQAEGAAYIHKMLDDHGELSRQIYGLHLHQSISGDYVRTHTGQLPADYPADDGNAQCAYTYPHVQRIDTHSPWTDGAVRGVIERIAPQFITHELSASQPAQKFADVRCQQRAMAGE